MKIYNLVGYSIVLVYMAGCLALVAEDAVWHSPVGVPRRGRDGFAEAIEEA